MSDDELPINYVAPRLRESDVFCMPSADILASQRAREKELRQLASQHEEQGDMSVRLGSGSRDSQSSSSESESSLAAAVDALEVGAAPHEPAAEPNAAPDAADIVAALAIQLVHYDTQFLSLYLELLQSTNDNLINAATNEISSNIEVAVADALQTGCVRSEREVAVLVSWLCAATVWTGPRVPAARSLLQAILATATTEAAEAAGRALGAAVRRAGALVRAADAARGPAPAAARLANALLRAALDRLAPERRGEGGEEREGGAAAVCARLGGAWRGLDAPERHAALQLVGRAPHLHQAGPRAALREWLARAAQPAPGHHRHSPDYLKILVGASKLQILFKVMETKNIYNEEDGSKNNNGLSALAVAANGGGRSSQRQVGAEAQQRQRQRRPHHRARVRAAALPSLRVQQAVRAALQRAEHALERGEPGARARRPRAAAQRRARPAPAPLSIDSH